MKLIALGIVAVLAATGPVNTTAPELPEAAALSSLAALAAGPVRACGFEISCTSARHRVDSDGPFGEWNATHPCMSPANHSGPTCGLVTLDVDDVRDMTLDEVRDHVATNYLSELVINEAGQTIDVLDCQRATVVGRVTFAQLQE